MHFITDVQYEDDYALLLTFEDGSVRRVDLADELEGDIFEPLRDLRNFQTAHLNEDIDTVVWDNGADMAPDFLYDISKPVDAPPLRRVAEERTSYGTA